MATSWVRELGLNLSRSCMEYVARLGSSSSCKASNKDIMGFGRIARSRRNVCGVLQFVMRISVLIQAWSLEGMTIVENEFEGVGGHLKG